MSLAALNDIGDAVEATRRLLRPFDRVRWFRLAVVMFFVGGGALSVPTPPGAGFNTGDLGPNLGEPGGPGGPDITPQLTGELVALVVGVAAVGLLVFLAYSVLSATMEFVFVASLRDEEVRLRRNVGRYWREGVRLFAFRFGVWVLSLGLAAGGLFGVGTTTGGWPPTAWSDGTVVALFALGVTVTLLVALVVGTVVGFTTTFVVPVMLREDRGVVGGWRRLWPTLTSDWTEFLAYLVVNFLLGVAIGIASGFLLVLVAVALAVPFLAVGAPLVLVVGLSGGGGVVVLVFVLAYVLLVFAGRLLVQVPFKTFTRYYALLVLGDVNSEFDVVPDTRQAVRSDSPDDGTGRNDRS